MTITLTREEAQQVLDALADAAWCVQHNNLPPDEGHDWDKELELLRTRLAQPEPNSELKVISTGVTHIYSTGAPDAIQYDKDGNEMAHWKFRSFAPPQREWQGLTAEDNSEIYNRNYNLYAHDMHIGDFFLIQQAVEAKLKEKNS
jgi:hypothetical protein